jgi:hypothetical protein
LNKKYGKKWKKTKKERKFQNNEKQWILWFIIESCDSNQDIIFWIFFDFVEYIMKDYKIHRILKK